MEISMFNQLYPNSSLDDVINGLSTGLRANIPYSDSQTYTKARLTTDVITGDEIGLIDNEFSGLDTLELIMELENSLHAIWGDNYDPDVLHGAAISAVLLVSA